MTIRARWGPTAYAAHAANARLLQRTGRRSIDRGLGSDVGPLVLYESRLGVGRGRSIRGNNVFARVRARIEALGVGTRGWGRGGGVSGSCRRVGS